MNGPRSTITGSCLCGAVTFETDAHFKDAYFCHCAQCRKITGSAHASNLIGKPGSLRWTTGEEHIRNYAHPTRDFSKAFCSQCGSGLPYLNRSNTAVVVPAGSLDGEPEIARGSRIFWADRSAWGDRVANHPHHDGFPE